MSGGMQMGMGMMQNSEGLWNAMHDLGQSIENYRFRKDLSRDLSRIEDQTATASMVQSVLGNLRFGADLKRKQALAKDLTQMTSQESINERARFLPEYGEESARVMAAAKATGDGRTVLQAHRAGKSGRIRAQAENIGEAKRLIDLDVGERVREFEAESMDIEKKRRREDMLFNLFSMQQGLKKRASRARHEKKLHRTGMLRQGIASFFDAPTM